MSDQKAYLVRANTNAVSPPFDGNNTAVVVADSPADAKAMAKSKAAGDPDVIWDSAEVIVLEVPPPFHGSTATLQGWKFLVRVKNPSGAVVLEREWTGGFNDDIDSIMQSLASEVSSDPTFNSPLWDSNENRFYLDFTGASLAGDHTVEFEVTPHTSDINIPFVGVRPGYPGAVPIPGFVLGYQHQASNPETPLGVELTKDYPQEPVFTVPRVFFLGR